jgi:hypothetical protein
VLNVRWLVIIGLSVVVALAGCGGQQQADDGSRGGGHCTLVETTDEGEFKVGDWVVRTQRGTLRCTDEYACHEWRRAHSGSWGVDCSAAVRERDQ